MAVFSYTQIADYILDQLWGFASSNSLKNSVRYIAEDILGNPSANSNNVLLPNNLTVNGDSSFGNAITNLTTITGELKGSRMMLIFGGGNQVSADNYQGLGTIRSLENPYKMHRAGSVVGYSLFGACVGYTSNITANIRIRKNASNFISSAALVWTAINQFQSEQATITRGTSTFVVGDQISLFFDYVSGTANIELSCLVEVQLDT